MPASQVLAAVNATIGKRSDGFFFKGRIDEVRIYNRALSAAAVEIARYRGVDQKRLAVLAGLLRSNK